MRHPYYIFTCGSIHRKDNTIAFRAGGGSYTPETDTTPDPTDHEEIIDLRMTTDKATQPARHIPIRDIESLHIMGNITVNSTLLRFLGQHAIPMHCYNHYGYYSGTYYPREYLHSGKLLVRQVESYSRDEARIELVRHLVYGTGRNMLVVLAYYRNRGKGTAIAEGMIRDRLQDLERVSTVQQAMGLEGAMRNAYYSAFPAILIPGIEFHGRVRRPPDNLANALLSYCNGLLYTACIGEIFRTQLSPLVSFLHEPGERRFSLALDIADIFKPIFVDRLVFSLLNKRVITANDVKTGERGCILKDRARRDVVAAFDEKMRSTIIHRKLEREVSLRRLIRLECYKLVKHLIGDEEYHPFVAWW